MYLLSSMSETIELFPWTKQTQKILQNTTGCHSAKNPVFGSQNDYCLGKYLLHSQVQKSCSKHISALNHDGSANPLGQHISFM